MKWKRDSLSCALKCQVHPCHHGNQGPRLPQGIDLNRQCRWKGGCPAPPASSPHPSWKRRVVRWCLDTTCCLTLCCNILRPSLSLHVSLARGKGKVLQKLPAMTNRGSPQGPKALWYHKLSPHMKKIRYRCGLHKRSLLQKWIETLFHGPLWLLLEELFDPSQRMAYVQKWNKSSFRLTSSQIWYGIRCCGS